VNNSSGMDLIWLWQVVCRRKYLILAVGCVVFSLTAYYTSTLPLVFRSRTVILVTPQRLPSSYIQTTVTAPIEQRVKTMAQQILGRANVESIIEELDLYPGKTGDAPMADRIQKLRKKINILTVRGTGRGRPAESFELSFDADSPQTALKVTERLSALFIEENLRVREEQAAGTTSFINAETDGFRKDLEEQEARVNQYKAQYRFELPEQIDANLRMLDQSRRELENGMLRLSSLQERKANLEKQLSEPELIRMDSSVASSGAGSTVPTIGGVDFKRRELEFLRQKYSEKHPDVIRLNREIKGLEFETPVEKTAPAQTSLRPMVDLRTTLTKHSQDLQIEIESLQALNERLRGQVASFQNRIDNTPLRAIELTKITRSYEITLGKYKELLARGLDSKLSENMEKKQKGEQFQLFDPPSFSNTPIAPNRPQILFIGLALGLAAGFGIAFLLEKLDKSFLKPEDLDGYIDVPVFAALPLVATRGSVLAARKAGSLLVFASIVVVVIGVVLIRLLGSLIPIA